MAEITEEVKTIEIPTLFNPEVWKPTPTEPVVAVAEVTEVVKEEIKEGVKVEENNPVITEEKKVVETPIPQEIKFANEESEKVFNLLKEGKIDDVYSIISEQKKLSTADKLPPADIIKLNLQYQNKAFNQQEINDLFEETYNYPEKPIQSISEDDDDFKARNEKYQAQVDKIDKRIARDAKPATAELLKLSKEIVLPEIPKQEPVTKEPTQEELDALKTQEQVFLKSVDESLNALSGYVVKYKDEEVEMQIPYSLTKEKKAEIQPLIALSHSNASEFLSKIGWLDADGNLNAAKLAEDLPFILNKEEILQKMVTETGNQRYAEAKKSIKNIDYSGGKGGGGDIGPSGAQLEKQWVTGFFSK